MYFDEENVCDYQDFRCGRRKRLIWECREVDAAREDHRHEHRQDNRRRDWEKHEDRHDCVERGEHMHKHGDCCCKRSDCKGCACEQFKHLSRGNTILFSTGDAPQLLTATFREFDEKTCCARLAVGGLDTFVDCRDIKVLIIAV